jgi:hypothetical protein
MLSPVVKELQQHVQQAVFQQLDAEIAGVGLWRVCVCVCFFPHLAAVDSIFLAGDGSSHVNTASSSPAAATLALPPAQKPAKIFIVFYTLFGHIYTLAKVSSSSRVDEIVSVCLVYPSFYIRTVVTITQHFTIYLVIGVVVTHGVFKSK